MSALTLLCFIAVVLCNVKSLICIITVTGITAVAVTDRFIKSLYLRALWRCKLTKKRKIEKARSETKEVMKRIKRKRDIEQELKDEVGLTLDLIEEYWTMCMRKSHLNFCSRHELVERFEEAYPLVSFCTDKCRLFERDLRNVSDGLKLIYFKLMNHINEVNDCAWKADEATSFMELHKISVPSLDWLKDYPEPNIAVYDSRWKAMGMVWKLRECIAKLRLFTSATSDA